MPFGNESKDYVGPANMGFGSLAPAPTMSESKKTADVDPCSALCPQCRQETVEDISVGIDAAGSKPVCGNCGWEGKSQLI